MKRKIHINATWDGDFGEEICFDGDIEIEDEVIKAVDDEWRSKFYDFFTPEEIAEHIAFNMIVNRAGLSRLDGFANFPDDYARIIKAEIVKEAKCYPRKRRKKSQLRLRPRTTSPRHPRR